MLLMSRWRRAQAPECHQGSEHSLGTGKLRSDGSRPCGISLESIVPLDFKYWLNLWASFVRHSGGPLSSGQKVEKHLL